MKTKRPIWKVLLLCAIPFVPLLAATSFRDVSYRIASNVWPPLREGLSEKLRRSVHVKGNLKTIKQLVARGADVNYAPIFAPALGNAIQGQRPDLALFLVQNGANPNFRVSMTGSTLFYRAVTELDSPQLVKAMLEHGAMTKGANGEDDPILGSAFSQKKSLNARVLIKAGANVNERGNYSGADFTPLMWAAFLGDVETLEMLLTRGALVNAQVTTQQYKGNTALMFAAYKKNARVVEMLLKSGANPNLVPQKRWDDLSQSALLQAVVNYMGQPQKLSPNQRRMARALLAHGADVNLGNEYSMPLQSVSSRFAPDIVREFLRRGAKVNWQNTSGWSALMGAADVGDMETVKLLLGAGANKSLHDKYGKTALYWARREKHLNVVRVLEAAK